MSNLVFPALPGLKWSSFRTPMWSNTVKTTDSGREFARSAWSSPRWSYRLQYEFLRADALGELQQLVGFFNTHRGDFDTWLFLDVDDSTALDQQIGVGDGVTTQFQLLRGYGGYVEPVYEPFTSGAGTPVVKVGGVLQVAGTDYTLGANGLVTFAAAPASGAITWSGSFYWRCRFKQSQIEFEQFMRQLWSARAVEFITRKP